MTSAHEWFRTVAASLGDDKPGQPFRRYALKDMVAHFNDAMCLIAKHRPDLFTVIKNIPLSCGSLQDARGCCLNIVSVLAQVDAYGNEIKVLTENKKTATKVRSVWTKPSCLSQNKVDPVTGESLTYVIDTVDLDVRINGRFAVHPPVPPDVDAYVLVQCQSVPCSMTEAAVLADTAQVPVDCGYLAMTRFYVMAWALTGNRHSTNSQAESTRLFKMFFDWLGIAEAQEKKYEQVVA